MVSHIFDHCDLDIWHGPLQLKMVTHRVLLLKPLKYQSDSSNIFEDKCKLRDEKSNAKWMGVFSTFQMLITSLPVTLESWKLASRRLMEHFMSANKCFYEKIIIIENAKMSVFQSRFWRIWSSVTSQTDGTYPNGISSSFNMQQSACEYLKYWQSYSQKCVFDVFDDLDLDLWPSAKKFKLVPSQTYTNYAWKFHENRPYQFCENRVINRWTQTKKLVEIFRQAINK